MEAFEYQVNTKLGLQVENDADTFMNRFPGCHLLSR